MSNTICLHLFLLAFAKKPSVHLRAKDDASVPKLKNKLIEASRVYSKDKETVSWFVMQSVHDKRDFTIVERYEKESVRALPLANVRVLWHTVLTQDRARNITLTTPTGRLLTPTSSLFWRATWTSGGSRSSTHRKMLLSNKHHCRISRP
jgi:hypothetical protein